MEVTIDNDRTRKGFFIITVVSNRAISINSPPFLVVSVALVVKLAVTHLYLCRHCGLAALPCPGCSISFPVIRALAVRVTHRSYFISRRTLSGGLLHTLIRECMFSAL